MMKRRSRLQIYLDVLRVIKNGVEKPTHIMYKCNLSWIPLNEILESMIAQGVIVKRGENRKKRYKITEKGENVLRYLSKAKELMVVGDFRKT